ncbi:MAG TPA: AAA family ATPase [Nitrososphaera sp.]|nr:AAA family ATPase [Nitrososphaera sp.]
MKLVEHLLVGTPLIWVTTDESSRVIEHVVEAGTNRPVFRMDAFQKFVEWDAEKKRWLTVLVEFTNDEGQTYKEETDDMTVALRYVLDRRGIMIIDHAHLSAEALMIFYAAIQDLYRTAFYDDDFEEVPAQFVLLSCKPDKLPQEIGRHTVRVDFPLPTEEVLKEILEHTAESSDAIVFANGDTQRIARAGRGMSETEFVTTLMLSLNQHGRFDHELVNAIKLDNLKQEGLLEVRDPSLSVDDIGGLDNAKKLIEAVAWSWRHPDEAKEFGLEPLRRVLLIGVPGSGKSAICEATARQLNLQLGKGGVSNVMNKYVGESEANMRRLWKLVKAMAPMVFWIDEFGRDLSGSASSSAVDGGTTDRVHGEFLTGLQELPENVFLMCAANRIDTLPPEMTRADRFDKIMFVGFPTITERQDIFKIHLGEAHEEYDVAKLARGTTLFTGAEIKALIREVRFSAGAVERRKMTTADLIKAIPHVKGRVWVNHRGPIVEMYERARVEWDWASSEQEENSHFVLQEAREEAKPKTFTAPPAPEPPGAPQEAPAKQPQVKAPYVPKDFGTHFKID